MPTAAPSVEVVEITPDMAREFLELNTEENRVVRGHKVEQFARAIESDEWRLTHQGIAFDKSGKLQDGQHRLHAVIMANKPILSYVFRNCQKENFAVLDQGLARGIADRHGIGQRKASAIGLLARIIGIRRPTPGEEHMLIEAWGDNLDEAIACIKPRKYFATSAIICGAALRFAEFDEEGRAYVRDVGHKLSHGEFTDLPPVGGALVNYILANMATVNSDRKNMLVRAYIMFDPNNKDMKKIVLRNPGLHLEKISKIIQDALDLPAAAE